MKSKIVGFYYFTFLVIACNIDELLYPIVIMTYWIPSKILNLWSGSTNLH